MLRLKALAMAIGLMLAVAAVATAGSIQPGDLIVVDRGNGTLDDVNPTTGVLNFVIASGFTTPEGVAINAQGTIFVSDIGTQTIDAVNPNTGVVTTYSGNGVGTGTALDRPLEMAFGASGTLYVANGATSDTTSVLAIASNGDRTVIAGNNGSSTNVFAQALNGITINPTTGNLYVSTATGNTIYQVTQGGSVTSVYANSSQFPQGLALSSGQVLFANGGTANPAVYSVNPSGPPTQTPTLVSNNFTVGTSDLFGLAVAASGTIYATSVSTPDVIYAINPTDGDATIISGNGVGGTTFGALSYGIAIYPTISSVPEPSSLMLLALGTIAVILYGRRRVPRLRTGATVGC